MPSKHQSENGADVTPKARSIRRKASERRSSTEVRTKTILEQRRMTHEENLFCQHGGDGGVKLASVVGASIRNARNEGRQIDDDVETGVCEKQVAADESGQKEGAQTPSNLHLYMMRGSTGDREGGADEVEEGQSFRRVNACAAKPLPRALEQLNLYQSSDHAARYVQLVRIRSEVDSGGIQNR
ncbi:hypothetical protein B0H17DRAFT_1152382 [Mycena rosella]|uniref:Uncharacterized protein n=1 Tax=Mycena rosella TaxID=1033263 RepID=A0AAD7BDQ2_MYCRO|nr:hypothetical protein B0H17DRAFT_1152382 [Mycena rosella]